MRDDRRQKLIVNLVAGMSKPEAARAAGYSESFCRVNVYVVTASTDFQEELAKARAASVPASQRSSETTSALHSASGNVLEAQDTGIIEIDLADGLTLKERRFIDFYLGASGGNATEACRLAGYSGNNSALGAMGSTLLRKPKVKQAIERLLSPVMGAEEVLEGLSKQARASIADVLDDSGSFDLNVAKQRGTDGLLRKVKIRKRIEYGKDGFTTEHIDHDVEIHNSQKALELMGNHHGVLGDTSPESFEHGEIQRQELIAILQSALDAARDNDNDAPDCIDVTPRPKPREMAPPMPEPVAALTPISEDPSSNLPAFLFRHPLNDCPT